jgi:uncharacterized protein
MKIIALTDIHAHNIYCEPLVNDIRQADLVILAGDITHFGKIAHLQIVLHKIRSLNTKILAVHGNCDFPEVLEELQHENLSIHGEIKSVNGIQLLGIGGSLPCPGVTPSEYSEQEMKEILDHSVDRLQPESEFLFISHQPPHNTFNDMLASGAHVGSKSIRSFIEKYQPLACITGHIHEGYGMDQIGRTKIINPGPFRVGNYLYLEVDKDLLKIDIRKCPA